MLGVLARAWQLGIEQRSFFARSSLLGWPVAAGIGGAFGYWIEGVDARQLKMLAERKDILLAKRARRDEREAAEAVA